MCKFCDPEIDDIEEFSEANLSAFNVDVGVLGEIEIYTYIDYEEKDTVNLVTEMYVCGTGDSERKSVPIYYCPMCGRKLG